MTLRTGDRAVELPKKSMDIHNRVRIRTCTCYVLRSCTCMLTNCDRINVHKQNQVFQKTGSANKRGKSHIISTKWTDCQGEPFVLYCIS